MMGDAAQPKGKPAKPPRAAARPKSRAFRWTIRLLFVALSLMITRGVLQTPEIRAMLDDGVATVLAVLAKERAQQDAMAGAARLEEMQGSALQQAPAPEMFEDRVAVRRSESPRRAAQADRPGRGGDCRQCLHAGRRAGGCSTAWSAPPPTPRPGAGRRTGLRNSPARKTCAAL
ncbi:hypothetical protein [Marinovum algicola]|uniref:hypothetical protein n=1 Tax=Marinovum algicola TaxID=42444 RepID=UPI003B51B960